MTGAFITVEGIEGVGKSTSIEAVAQCLRSVGRDVLLTREPGGTVLGEQIRDWILHGKHADLSPDVEALLMFAARAHHLATVIAPALEQGRWVVCDRFTDATWAYQGGGRGVPGELLTCLTKTVHRGIDPHLTLLLDAPVEVGRARIRDREPDHFERESEAFFERVRRTYLTIAAEQPERVKVVDASRPRPEVIAELENLLRGFSAAFAG